MARNNGKYRERVWIPRQELVGQPTCLYQPPMKKHTVVSVLGVGDSRKIRITQLNYEPKYVERDQSLRGTVNDEKLLESISRTKRTIYELSMCNEWDYFFTGTLDRTKYDRTDLDKYHHDLTQWFRDQGKKYGTKIQFLIIPELHGDGQSWHMHGLLRGLTEDMLTQFKIGDKMGAGLARKVAHGDVVYNWPAYQKKFGFCDLEPIRNHEAVSKYITKYISKELVSSVTELNAQKYYCSRGLKRAEVIKKGLMSANIKPDYEGEFASVTTLAFSDAILNEILGNVK